MIDKPPPNPVRQRAMRDRWDDPLYRDKVGRAVSKAARTRVPNGETRKRKVGRKYPQFSVSLDDDLYARIAKQAEKQNRSMSELVRTYIEWGLEEEEK